MNFQAGFQENKKLEDMMRKTKYTIRVKKAATLHIRRNEGKSCAETKGGSKTEEKNKKSCLIQFYTHE